MTKFVLAAALLLPFLSRNDVSHGIEINPRFAATSIITKQEDTTINPSSKCEDVINNRYPKQYVTYKLRDDQKIVLDGKLDEPAWQEVAYSDRFIDINTTTRPALGTHMKIRWDDQYLYVGGMIEDPNVWANITYCCHCINATEDQVIFHGNDFEFFVDADGTTRWYKEFEINAANADWDLLLDRPYENNGYENSSRVFGKKGFDMTFPPNPLKSATYTDGILNDPASKPTFWSVEIAFPLEKLAFKTTATVPPKQDDYWRINFSRVEWHVEVMNNKYYLYPSCQSCPVPGTKTCDNWVWTPMYVIDIHHPEMWGFLQFSEEPVNTTAVKPNNQWPNRYVAHELYYAQFYYSQAHNNTYTNKIEDLVPFANFPSVLTGDCTQTPSIWLNENRTQYLATIASYEPGVPTITIDENRLILAHEGRTLVPDVLEKHKAINNK